MGKVEGKTARPKLHLICGGYPSRVTVGFVDIIAAPENKAPFTVEAVAYEEDTFLVLSAPPELRDSQESLTRLMTQVLETSPETPGGVLVKGKSPLRLLAIVHDLNQEPSWKEEWIAGALEGIFREAEYRKLQSIALPFIGTRHGSLGKERFLMLLRNALHRISPSYPKLIWLMLPPGIDSRIIKILASKKRRY